MLNQQKEISIIVVLKFVDVVKNSLPTNNYIPTPTTPFLKEKLACYHGLRKQPTFGDATIGFPEK